MKFCLSSTVQSIGSTPGHKRRCSYSRTSLNISKQKPRTLAVKTESKMNHRQEPIFFFKTELNVATFPKNQLKAVPTSRPAQSQKRALEQVSPSPLQSRLYTFCWRQPLRGQLLSLSENIWSPGAILIDAGCTTNLMSRNTLIQICSQSQNHLQSSENHREMADESKITLYETMRTTTNLQTVQTEGMFTVGSIIGMPSLVDQNFLLNFDPLCC